MASKLATHLAELIDKVEALADRAQRVQAPETAEPQAALTALRSDYGSWYAKALTILPEDLARDFRKEYEGGFPHYKIKHFLQDGLMPTNAMMAELVAQGTVSPWQYPSEKSFCAPLREQQQILRNAAARITVGGGAIAETFDVLEAIFRNLPRALAVLSQEVQQRPGLVVQDEYDLQRIVHAVLCLNFADVRPEEYAPSRAGARPRIDFLLKDEHITVETKGPRDALTPAKLGNELAEDLLRYQSHPDADAYFALVYDPRRKIINASGFENDLATGAIFPTRVVIVH